MARRFTLSALSALASALVLTACGGAQNAADESETRTAPPAPETSKSAPERPGSPSPSVSATRTPTASPSPSASASPPGEPSPDAAFWTTARKSGAAAGAPDEAPVLEAVRVGRHPTFHRVVLEFSQGTPEFYAEYTETLRQDGSGRKIAIRGEHVLLLVLRGMTPESHFDDTAATSVVRDVVTASIFEGDMRIGIGLDTGDSDRPGFRVLSFGDKLVLDFAHTD